MQIVFCAFALKRKFSEQKVPRRAKTRPACAGRALGYWVYGDQVFSLKDTVTVTGASPFAGMLKVTELVLPLET